MELNLLKDIQTFANNHHTLSYLRHAIVGHVYLMEFHMVAKTGEIVQNHLYDFSFPQAQDSLYIFSNKIFGFLFLNDFAEETIQDIPFVIDGSMQVCH
mgnify:CR=1 FL=1